MKSTLKRELKGREAVEIKGDAGRWKLLSARGESQWRLPTRFGACAAELLRDGRARVEANIDAIVAGVTKGRDCVARRR